MANEVSDYMRECGLEENVERAPVAPGIDEDERLVLMAALEQSIAKGSQGPCGPNGEGIQDSLDGIRVVPNFPGAGVGDVVNVYGQRVLVMGRHAARTSASVCPSGYNPEVAPDGTAMCVPEVEEAKPIDPVVHCWGDMSHLPYRVPVPVPLSPPVSDGPIYHVPGAMCLARGGGGPGYVPLRYLSLLKRDHDGSAVAWLALPEDMHLDLEAQKRLFLRPERWHSAEDQARSLFLDPLADRWEMKVDEVRAMPTGATVEERLAIENFGGFSRLSYDGQPGVLLGPMGQIWLRTGGYLRDWATVCLHFASMPRGAHTLFIAILR